MQYKKCECNDPLCDIMIPVINTRGKPARFAIGHNFKGKNNPSWRGGEYIDFKGYVRVKTPEDHPSWIYNRSIGKHRLIMEDHLGRYLRPEEHVHHKDNNKLNNHISNLELLDRSQHSKITTKTNPRCQKIDMNGRICLVCNSDKTSPSSRNGQPHWLRHPITKEKWVCKKCYKRIKRNNKK